MGNIYIISRAAGMIRVFGAINFENNKDVGRRKRRRGAES